MKRRIDINGVLLHCFVKELVLLALKIILESFSSIITLLESMPYLFYPKFRVNLDKLRNLTRRKLNLTIPAFTVLQGQF